MVGQKRGHCVSSIRLTGNVFKTPEQITGSAVALHCCKVHSKIKGKMENSTPPCKIVTPDSFILKLGTRDYAEDVTYYTIFDVDRFRGGFSPNM